MSWSSSSSSSSSSSNVAAGHKYSVPLYDAWLSSFTAPCSCASPMAFGSKRTPNCPCRGHFLFAVIRPSLQRRWRSKIALNYNLPGGYTKRNAHFAESFHHNSSPLCIWMLTSFSRSTGMHFDDAVNTIESGDRRVNLGIGYHGSHVSWQFKLNTVNNRSKHSDISVNVKEELYDIFRSNYNESYNFLDKSSSTWNHDVSKRKPIPYQNGSVEIACNMGVAISRRLFIRGEISFIEDIVTRIGTSPPRIRTSMNVGALLRLYRDVTAAVRWAPRIDELAVSVTMPLNIAGAKDGHVCRLLSHTPFHSTYYSHSDSNSRMCSTLSFGMAVASDGGGPGVYGFCFDRGDRSIDVTDTHVNMESNNSWVAATHRFLDWVANGINRIRLQVVPATGAAHITFSFTPLLSEIGMSRLQCTAGIRKTANSHPRISLGVLFGMS